MPGVEIEFCQYSDGSISGEIKNIPDRHVAEFWDLLKNYPPLTIEGSTSSGESFVFHSFYADQLKIPGKDFEVTRIGLVEGHKEYDFKIEFGLLQMTLYQVQQIKCNSPFGEFVISPVPNIKEILKEIKIFERNDVTCHISFTFSSSKENLEEKILEIVVYLESIMVLLSFAEGVFINYIYYNLYIKDAGGFKLYKSVHRLAKTKKTTLDELILTRNIQNFLEFVLPIFTKDFQEQTGIGDAIEWYLESTGSNIIQSRFIHACIAIELLNDRFKKSKNSGKILTDEEFKELEEKVRN
ncbi:MAG: hypothetical protein SVJ22_07650 [Halobacteriota archaeon]|nr:hypothetical protein [Halobacteriota archaeon]